ncbi:MAG: hypothetical protein ACXWQE_09515, partial [Bdellovibrionales bacterium]
MASFSWAAEARTSCEDRLKKTGYVKLKSAGVHEDVAELVREIRAQVKENLGWLPQIKYTDLTEFSLLSDIRMFEPG